MTLNIIIPSKYFKGSGMNGKKTKLSPNFYVLVKRFHPIFFFLNLSSLRSWPQ